MKNLFYLQRFRFFAIAQNDIINLEKIQLVIDTCVYKVLFI